MRKKDVERKITFADRTHIERVTFKRIQEEAFEAELRLIQRNNPLSKRSKLCHLNPILDQHGLLRVDGRLVKSPIPD